MAVYYKFKSAKDYDSITIEGHFISVATLKEKIFESKHLGRGTDFDLVVTNAQTNEEYLDEASLIPKNTSVLIRRVPGRPRMPIVTAPVNNLDEAKNETKLGDSQPAKSNFSGGDSSAMRYPEDSEWDEFGNDLYAIPEVLPVQSANPIQDGPPPCKADEDSKIRALIDTPALDWQRQTSDGFGPGGGFGRSVGGRIMDGRGFGRSGLERKIPPPGYICHRCKTAGHFIQHCPTNGDPNYDIKRMKPPTGIPKSMLIATTDGSYALPSGAVAVLKPNEAAFEKEIEGLPSTRSVGDLPLELHCPLCKEVMKDAVLTSKCCFNSYCDKCIRDFIISKSMCVCGATNILADDLLPNKTLRDTINRILESNNNSADNGGSAFQAQDMESTRCPLPKVPSPTQSVASRGEQMPLPQNKDSNLQDIGEHSGALNVSQQPLHKSGIVKVPDISESAHVSMGVKEPTSQVSAQMVDEEVQQKPLLVEAGKKKKKVRWPLSAAEIQWNATQDYAAESFMLPMGPSAYNPYCSGIPGMEGFAPHYSGAIPYMGYLMSPMNVQFGGFLHQDPCGGMFPFVPPQRDLADFGMDFYAGPPIMSRGEFEARKAELQRKREIDRRNDRDLSKDGKFCKEMSCSSDISSVKSKSKSIAQPPLPPSPKHRHHRQQTPDQHPRGHPDKTRLPSKRKSDYDSHDNHHRRDHHEHRHHLKDKAEASAPRPSSAAVAASASATATVSELSSAAADNKQKTSVFCRISFPEEDASKKQKVLRSLSDALAGASANSRKSLSNGYQEDDYRLPRESSAATTDAYESSENDDRHFKRRRPSRYVSSPPKAALEEDERHARGSRERERERERDRDRSGHSIRHR